MTCSKQRLAFRLSVENLESRLQPGSLILGQGYGWSLLADHLAILNPDSTEVRLKLTSSSATDPSALIHRTAATPQERQDLAVVRMTAPVVTPAHPATKNLVDNLAADWNHLGLGLPAVAEARHVVALSGAQNSIVSRLTPTPVAAGFTESPIGVATPAPAAVSLSNGPSASPLLPNQGLSGSARTSTQEAQASPAPALQATPRAAAGGTTPVLRPIINLHVTIQHESTEAIRTFSSHPSWVSYLGGSGDDRILGLAYSPVAGAAQPILATGFTQSTTDPTEYDGFVAMVSADGTSATVATLSLGSGTRTEGHGLDVDAAGNIYVIGQTGQTNDPTTTTDLIVRLDRSGNLTWATGLTPSGSTGVGNALKLDATGTNLYVTGAIDNNLSVGELSGLSAAMPKVVYATSFPFAAGDSVGTAIAPDSFGDADLGFTLTTSGTTDNRPGIAQVASDGTLANSGAFASVGAKSGTFGIAVDAGDNFYFTGGLEASGTTNEVLLVGEYDVTFTRQYAFTYRFNDVATGNQVDAVGRAIQVDDGGNAFMAVMRDGGPINTGGTGTFMKLFEVDPTGGTSVDNQQLAHGTGDDENRALVLDINDGVFYMAGFTNSPDFNLTAGTFQPTYGGDPYDGVLIQEQLF